VVSGNTPTFSKLRLDFRSDGWLYIRNSNRGGGTSATYKIREADSRICIFINNGLGGDGWKMLQDCYRLFEVAEKKFVMRSVSDNYFISYAKN